LGSKSVDFGTGSIDDIETTLRAGRFRYPRRGENNFLSFKMSRRALGPPQPPIQSIPAFNPEDKAGGLRKG